MGHHRICKDGEVGNRTVVTRSDAFCRTGVSRNLENM